MTRLNPLRQALAVLALGAASVAAQAEPASYVLDPTHTFVTFEISHFGTSTNRGRFDKKQGTVQMDRAAGTGKLEVTIETGSVNSGTAAFDKHLKSADILNAEAHPTARFVSDRFVFAGDKLQAVEGQFTLLGKTHPVTLKALNFNCYQSPMLKREVCGGDFEATIDRTQWGLDYGVAFGQPKQMKLVIQAEGVRQ